MTKESSYIAAGTIPTKLLHNEIIKGGKIVPIHLQLIPTNDCNLKCSFCSCKDSDRKKFLTLEQMTSIIDEASKRGTKAITITGGGEPLMHQQINEMIRYSNKKGIQVGLTTNGVLLNKLEKHSNITWCRISSSDDRKPVYSIIEKAVKLNSETDWAFAHVVTDKPRYDLIKGIVEFANEYNFSHVKLHPNLFDIDKVPMDKVRDSLKNVDTSKVIYQNRENVSRGARNCYIGLLKPMVAPEGVFPCCGVQYAISGSKKEMVNEMKWGEIKDLGKILDEQIPFDGSRCDVCYYGQYNDILAKLKDKPKHKEFV